MRFLVGIQLQGSFRLGLRSRLSGWYMAVAINWGVSLWLPYNDKSPTIRGRNLNEMQAYITDSGLV